MKLRVQRYPQDLQTVWMASTRYTEENADALKQFNAAMAEANEYAMTHQDEIREIDHALTQMPEDFIDTRELSSMDVSVDRGIFATIAEAMGEYGIIEFEVTADDVVWSEAPTP